MSSSELPESPAHVGVKEIEEEENWEENDEEEVVEDVGMFESRVTTDLRDGKGSVPLFDGLGESFTDLSPETSPERPSTEHQQNGFGNHVEDAYETLPMVEVTEDLSVHRLARSLSPSTDASLESTDDTVPEEGLTPEELAAKLGAGEDVRLNERVTRHLSFSGSRPVLRSRRQSADEEDEPREHYLTLSGRIGHGHIINGDYDKMDEVHDGAPVLRHCDPIPDGFEGISGVRLSIFYSQTNQAWAIAPQVGSMEVLAYIHGNVLLPEADLTKLDKLHWTVSNENGEYEIDPDIIMSGSMFNYGENTEEDDTSSIGSTETEDVVCEESIEEEMEESTGLEMSASVLLSKEKSNKFKFKKLFKKSKKKKSKQSANTDIDDDLNVQKPFSRKLTRSKSTHRKQKIKGGWKRQAEMPSITARKVLNSFISKTSVGSRRALVVQMRNLARQSRPDDESPELFCDVMLDIWIAILDCLDSTPVVEQEFYFNTIIAIMLREDFEIHGVGFTSDLERAERVLRVSLRTNEYVAGKLAPITLVLSQEMSFFCAKVMSINYFRIPGFANDIVQSIVQKTKISGVRGRRLGAQVLLEATEAHERIIKHIPFEKKTAFATIAAICSVKSTLLDANTFVPNEVNPHEVTVPRWTIPGSKVVATPEVLESLKQWQLSDRSLAGRLDSEDLRSITSQEIWGKRLFLAGTNGIEFLGVFLEILFRRALDLYEFKYFMSKSDKTLGINERCAIAYIFMPGYTEITTCFLRISLMTEIAFKPLYQVGHGPPSAVGNWTDRMAQCALALSKDGIFFSCMARDMMEQTSLTHILDVMALLRSLKLFMESYCHMHQESFNDSVNSELFVDFLTRLVGYRHYVVIMFALRWMYESIDCFAPAHRLLLLNVLLSPEILDNTFCHWEPAIRHLSHMLILYRLVPAEHATIQLSLFEKLETLLSGQVADPISTNNESSTIASIAGQCELCLGYIKNILVCHGAIVLPPGTRGDVESKAIYKSRYATSSLEELKMALAHATEWVKGHRSTAKDELYPPVQVHVPPLQNMTSAYDCNRLRK